MTISRLTANNQIQFFEAISNDSIMAILCFTWPALDCVYLNRMALEMFELPMNFQPEDLQLENLTPVASNDPHLRQFSSEIVHFEGLVQEVMVRKFNGQNFIASIGIKKAVAGDKEFLLLMFQDMTIQSKLQRDVAAKQNALRSAYEELLLQNKQLRDLDVAKNRFIALTTHELRTPLSAMIASAEVLKFKVYDSETEHDEFVEMIYNQGMQLMELINDILDFARIQAGKMDFYLEELDLREIVVQQIEAMQKMADDHKISIQLLPATGETKCYFDSVRIRQVITNILSNAIKYNRPEGQVTVWLEAQDAKVSLFVKDTGVGISKDQQEQVFNEFETLGKVALHSKGTGLGMPISRRLMVSMGGTLQLTSEEGIGSTFWIEVPRERVANPEWYRQRPDSSGDLAA